MERIVIKAPISTFTSYGILAIQFTQMLEKFGYEVAIRPMSQSEQFGSKIPASIKRNFVYKPQPEEWELAFHPPDAKATEGKKSVLFTMYESTQLSERQKYFLSQFDAIITPCQWGATVFSANGVNKPIKICPLGVDTKTFSYGRMSNSPAEVVFGAAGRLAHGGVRKGLNDVIHLFRKAFPGKEKVKLKIKAFEDCNIASVNDSRIEINQKWITEQEIAQWIRSLTCFVSAARSEGWGLLQHQSLACGRPVISTQAFGLRNFVTEMNSYPVGFEFETAMGYYRGHWAKPNFDEIVDRMRELYHDVDRACEKGVVGTQDVAPLSLENSGRHLENALKELGAIAGGRPGPKDPIHLYRGKVITP